VSTPADQNVKLLTDDGHSKPVNPVHYQSMVGSLLYAAMAIEPLDQTLCKPLVLYQSLMPVQLWLISVVGENRESVHFCVMA